MKISNFRNISTKMDRRDCFISMRDCINRNNHLVEDWWVKLGGQSTCESKYRSVVIPKEMIGDFLDYLQTSIDKIESELRRLGVEFDEDQN